MFSDVIRGEPIDQMLEATERNTLQRLRENQLTTIQGLASFPIKLATMRGKNRLRSQIVGIENHVKTHAIVGLQPTGIKICRTDIGEKNCTELI